jgi:hypothetical protein
MAAARGIASGWRASGWRRAVWRRTARMRRGRGVAGRCGCAAGSLQVIAHAVSRGRSGMALKGVPGRVVRQAVPSAPEHAAAEHTLEWALRHNLRNAPFTRAVFGRDL